MLDAFPHAGLEILDRNQVHPRAEDGFQLGLHLSSRSASRTVL
jgi:hypothetical protein